MPLKEHIPPTLHNAFGTLFAAAITGALGAIYALFTHSWSVTFPLWLLVMCLVLFVSVFTWLILRYRRRVRQLTAERDQLAGKVEKREQPSRAFQYPRRSWVTGW